MNIVDEQIRKLTKDLMVSLRRYEAAKTAFVDAMDGVRSATDFRDGGPAKVALETAMSDGAWLQGEIRAYGSALAGLRLSQMGDPQ